MARQLNKLTAIQVKKLTKAGRHSDGGGLYLHISKNGGRRWIYRYSVKAGDKARLREMGLGSARDVSLAQARQLRQEASNHVLIGRDPIAERDKDTQTFTFGKAATDFVNAKEGEWKNEKHRAQWRSTLETHCAAIWEVPVDQIGIDEVLGVLKPIWGRIPETATRVRGRIERVLNAAKARGWRSGENPALWRGNLDHLLPKPQKLARGHHAALPYKDVPDFMQMLRERTSVSARALEFLILTAARSGEVRGALWQEIDMEPMIWTIPAERMKAGRQHRVPLCQRAMEILKHAGPAGGDDYVFPGNRTGSALSDMTLSMMVRRLGYDVITVHGFRSSFRDWAAEETDHAREVAESALAHVIGDATERAYRRGDALEKRRSLMRDWEAFCTKKPWQS